VKSLRVLICAVLMTMAMAAATDASRDEEDLGERKRPIVPADGGASKNNIEGKETTWAHCGKLNCFKCNLVQALTQSVQLRKVTTGSNPVPTTFAAGDVTGLGSLNSLLSRVLQETNEPTMQALGGAFEVIAIRVNSSADADADAADGPKTVL
jgi:Fe-S cluster biogenesis protein NfuA